MKSWQERPMKALVPRERMGLPEEELETRLGMIRQSGEELPEFVEKWFARLYTLAGVPFPYLVPSERMLPPESMRFFSVDENWLLAAADGALSLGRCTSGEAAFDSLALPGVARRGSRGLPGLRRDRMHPNHKRNLGPPGTPEPGRMGGFLLRSQLAGHWQGIEVRGYEGETRLEILRMELLAEGLLLCLFDGRVDRVELMEPTEALHFGVRDDSRVIRLRAVSGRVGEDKGPLPLSCTPDGRVDFLKLAQDAAHGLGLQKEAVQSAEIALQMLSVADMGEVRAKKQKGGAVP